MGHCSPPSHSQTHLSASLFQHPSNCMDQQEQVDAAGEQTGQRAQPGREGKEVQLGGASVVKGPGLGYRAAGAGLRMQPEGAGATWTSGEEAPLIGEGQCGGRAGAQNMPTWGQG